MSKTFEDTCQKYGDHKYIILKYSKATKRVEKIIVTPPLSKQDIHIEYDSLLTVSLKDCKVYSF